MSREPVSYAMHMPLLLSHLLERSARHHAGAEIVSVIKNERHRYTYRDCVLRAKKVAQMVEALGAKAGDRVATLVWNDHRHLELYFGISGTGAICHTINPRLFPEQIAEIVHGAQDMCVVFDPDFLPLVEEIAGQCSSVKTWIMLDDVKENDTIAGTPLLDYEALLAQHDGDYEWPVLDENSPAFLCYTSGTTGNPKGVIYTHRATVLHAYACALPDSHNVSATEVVLPVVPMFHANAWEAPFTAILTGAKLVLPGPRLDGESLYRIIEAERVTFSIGVPTVWYNLLSHVRQQGGSFGSLRRLLLGGATTPPSMIAGYADLGVQLHQGWGMTETAALTTCTRPLAKHAGLDRAELQATVYENAGRIVAGADMRIVDANDRELPWGAGVAGNLQVRAPWATQQYYGMTESVLKDGWLPTGDVAQISEDGYMRLVDRTKDVIKSGGEWISSVDIEGIAMALPGVTMAACIAGAHPKWGERPLLVIQLADGAELSEDDVLKNFEGKVARWWIPDAVVFATDIPMTATGKMFKLGLRNLYGNYFLDRESAREHSMEQK